MIKKNFSSFIFTAVVLLIGGYSLYEYKYKTQENPADLNKVKLFSITPDQVKSIRLQQTDQRPILLEKKETLWTVTSDIEDTADVQQIAAFLAAVTSEKAKVAKKEGDIPWKDYQLDQPTFSLEIEDDKGKKESIAISSMHAFDGSYFIKHGNQLVIGEKSWGQHVTKTADSFRDKKLFREPFEPTKIDVIYDDNGLKQKFQLQRVGEKDAAEWQIVGKNMNLYDPRKIDQLIEQIKNLRANDFLPEPGTPKDVKRYGLDRVTSRIELTGSDNKSWWISFGTEDKTSVLARASSVKGVIAFTPGLVEKIRVSLESLRNGQLPFQYDVEQVKRVKISADQTKVDIKKSELTWVLTTADAKEANGKEVDQAQLAELFQKVQNLNAIQFLAKDPLKVKYNKSIQFVNAQDKEILLVRFSDEAQEGKNKVIYARTNKSNEALVLLASEVAGLPIHALIKDKAPTAPNPEPKDL